MRSVVFCALYALAMTVTGCSGGGSTVTPRSQSDVPNGAPIAAMSALRLTQISSTDSSSSTHVKTWGYWGQATEPAGVTAAYVASHLTFLEADPSHVSQFHSAGGTYGVKYTDPSRVIPARHEDLWTVPESGWFHDSSGRRIYTYFPGYGTQNMLNPEKSETRNAYVTLTQQIKSSAPYSYVEVDNTYYDLVGAFYGFNTPGVEAGSQSAYDNGIVQLLQGSAVTPIVNGLSNEDGGLNGVSGTKMFLPYAAGGINNEGCLQATYVKSVAQWEFDANTLLYTSAQHKWSVCWPQSAQTSDAHTERLFFLGSWWLTYDPTYSVAFPQFASHSGLFIFPEYAIVPLDPIQTANAHVSGLKDPSGVYVREFAKCYQAGTAIGACAAFVNPSSSKLTLPARAAAYRNMLSLDANNAYDGGKAGWESNSARTIAPLSSVIVAGLNGAPATPAPQPTPGGANITLYGTIAGTTATSLLTQSSCGYEYVYFDGSTPIAKNGYSLAAGTNLKVVGSGTCATSVNASQITLTGVGTTITGDVTSVSAQTYVVKTSGSCGSVPVRVDGSTTFVGPAPGVGASISATGAGSCSSGISATSVVTH